MKKPSLLEKLRRATLGSRTGAGDAAAEFQRSEAQVSELSTLPDLELVLGVDLGTSCTKVVIGDSGWKNTAWIVPYDEKLSGIAAYLHPTQFAGERNLKMRLMDCPGNRHVQSLLASCLAQTIQQACAWFQNNAPPDYAKRTVRWTLNLGFPGKSLEDSPLKAAYLDIAMRAMEIAFNKVPADACEESRKVFLPTDFRSESAKRPELYPEIAAQLAGYIRSPYGKSGSLLMVDVGAGTLDVSTLIVGRTAVDELVSFQVCRVADQGALRLHQRRMEALEAAFPGSVEHGLVEFQDGTKPLPENASGFVKETLYGMEAVFDAAGAAFAEDALDVVTSCVVGFRKRLKECHEQKGLDPFGKNLRLMLTGGGSRSGFFRKLIHGGALEDAVCRFTRWAGEAGQRINNGEGLLFEPLPVPRDIQNMPEAVRVDFDRLSVAYGLAFGGRNLMRVMCSSETVLGAGLREGGSGAQNRGAILAA